MRQFPYAVGILARFRRVSVSENLVSMILHTNIISRAPCEELIAASDVETQEVRKHANWDAKIKLVRGFIKGSFLGDNSPDCTCCE